MGLWRGGALQLLAVWVRVCAVATACKDNGSEASCAADWRRRRLCSWEPLLAPSSSMRRGGGRKPRLPPLPLRSPPPPAPRPGSSPSRNKSSQFPGRWLFHCPGAQLPLVEVGGFLLECQSPALAPSGTRRAQPPRRRAGQGGGFPWLGFGTPWPPHPPLRDVRSDRGAGGREAERCLCEVEKPIKTLFFIILVFLPCKSHILTRSREPAQSGPLCRVESPGLDVAATCSRKVSKTLRFPSFHGRASRAGLLAFAWGSAPV